MSEMVIISGSDIDGGLEADVTDLNFLADMAIQAHHYETLSEHLAMAGQDPRTSGAPVWDFSDEVEVTIPNTTFMENMIGVGNKLTYERFTSINRDDEISEAMNSYLSWSYTRRTTDDGTAVDLDIQSMFDSVSEMVDVRLGDAVRSWQTQNEDIAHSWHVVAQMHWGAQGLAEFNPGNAGPEGNNETWGLYGCWGGMAAGASSDTVSSKPITLGKYRTLTPNATVDDVELQTEFGDIDGPYIESGMYITSNWRGE